LQLHGLFKSKGEANAAVRAAFYGDANPCGSDEVRGLLLPVGVCRDGCGGRAGCRAVAIGCRVVSDCLAHWVARGCGGFAVAASMHHTGLSPHPQPPTPLQPTMKPKEELQRTCQVTESNQDGLLTLSITQPNSNRLPWMAQAARVGG